ncbi:MAG TPA: carboxymuconolactone decarboxylase family protein [Gemmatimonadaceae bacterium]|nr:carboxymuconolactone decarboxylase family protein [Gemmatimonadaceae bacterium]
MAASYDVHTLSTAPVRSRELLEALHTQLGAIPNLAAAMAESPQLLEGFLRIRDVLYNGTFTPAEVQVLALTNAFENGCTYCMALHSTLALKDGVPAQVVTSLRSGRTPGEPRLGALSALSRSLVRERGHARTEELDAFLAAGYTRAQALEVVLGIAVSLLPNFAHHLTRCPLDPIFHNQRWERPIT